MSSPPSSPPQVCKRDDERFWNSCVLAENAKKLPLFRVADDGLDDGLGPPLSYPSRLRFHPGTARRTEVVDGANGGAVRGVEGPGLFAGAGREVPGGHRSQHFEGFPHPLTRGLAAELGLARGSQDHPVGFGDKHLVAERPRLHVELRECSCQGSPAGVAHARNSAKACWSTGMVSPSMINPSLSR